MIKGKCDFLEFDPGDFTNGRGYYKCPECGKWYIDIWVSRHLRYGHGIEISDLYKKAHPEVDPNCPYCGKPKYWCPQLWALGPTCGDFYTCAQKSRMDKLAKEDRHPFHVYAQTEKCSEQRRQAALKQVEEGRNGLVNYNSGLDLEGTGIGSHYAYRLKIRDSYLSRRSGSETSIFYIMDNEPDNWCKFGVTLELNRRLNDLGGNLIYSIEGPIKDMAELEFQVSLKFKYKLIPNDYTMSEYMDRSNLNELLDFVKNFNLTN